MKLNTIGEIDCWKMTDINSTKVKTKVNKVEDES